MESLSNELLCRSIQAMTSAIEIYNKPNFPYRNESFTILAINGWELLLKAKWVDLHGNKKESLYVYATQEIKDSEIGTEKYIKTTRSNTPFTHSLGYLSKQLFDRKILDHSAYQNIVIMLEFRDCATHFYNESPMFNSRLYEIGAACVRNFVNAVREWFGRDVTEFNIHLMPLTYIDFQSNIEGSFVNIEEGKFLAFLDSIDEPNGPEDSPYSISVNVEFMFTKSRSKGAIPVQVTNDSSALTVQLTEEDIRNRYPWDYRSLTQKCRQRYRDFKENSKYHEIRKSHDTNQKFALARFLDPGNPKSSQKMFFNPNILIEFDKHYVRKNSII